MPTKSERKIALPDGRLQRRSIASVLIAHDDLSFVIPGVTGMWRVVAVRRQIDLGDALVGEVAFQTLNQPNVHGPVDEVIDL
ncbi:hypothetical protein B4Q13_24325, partial [Lacticaseibacillus rhamnosus]